MKKKTWTKVTRNVWVCDRWAVEDCDGYAELFRDGEFVWCYYSVEQAKRGATQVTLDKAAAEQGKLRANPPGLAKLKEVPR